MKYSDGLLFGAGLLVGAVVGGIAAALLTPRSGQEVREQVAERGLELRHRTEEVVQRAQQVASEAVTKVRSSAHELLGQQPGTAGAVEAGEPS